MNRISPKDRDRIKTYGSADDRMLEILELLKTTEIIPEVNNLYTFVYLAKTSGIEYDQHPLVVVTDIYRWGFRGFNFHWQSPHNYTWVEIVGYLHKVYKEELPTLLSLSYQKFRINI